jgi:hypothetical protein
MSVMDHRIARAARNNADWCEIVCASHGSPGVFVDTMWINRGRIPRFYPNAQTIEPDTDRQIELIKKLVHEPLPSGWALKDSFASLDLAPLGFTVLLKAQWIYLSEGKVAGTDAATAPGLRWEIVRSEDSLEEWERAWRDANGDTNTARIFLPMLLENPDVAIVVGFRGERIVAGAIGNLSAGVVGWSNFFAVQGEDARACALGSLGSLMRNFPDTAIVGYEDGDMLRLAESLGFESIGPLRVWLFTAG